MAEERKADQVRHSRLHGQVLISLALVVVAGLMAVVPAAPLGPARAGLTWLVTQDYDFAGKARNTYRWVQARVSPLTENPEPVVAVPVPVPQPQQPDTIMPVNGSVLYGFGWLPKGRQIHEGLDLAAAEGAPVAAIADGTVLRMAADPLLGAIVEVDHGFAVALYGQVRNARVKVGDLVKQGQTLAVVAKPSGKEGDAGAHLHLEMRPSPGGKAVDPTPYLPGGRSVQGGSGI